MIRTQTVFVLGAGANVPYGFSTGAGLLDTVRGVDVRALMGEAGKQVTAEACREFQRAVQDNMLPSIDALLEHREDLWPVGKRVMATLLYAQEAVARPPASAEDWMSFVFERMADGAGSLEEFGKNAVTFITFNYDRYFEHRLIRALVARYNRNERDAWDCLSGMKFLHVYGSLGQLPAQATASAPPGSTISLGAADEDTGIYSLGVALQQVEKSVRIIHDPTGAAPLQAFTDTHAFFARASQIFFLGFGFGKTNVDRLGTAGIASAKVYCTAYGMMQSEIDYFIRPAFPNIPSITNPAYDFVGVMPIRQFLRAQIRQLV